MARSTSRPPAPARSVAEARFRELLDELKLLTLSFPHLRDAYDPGDLPAEFLLKRGADRAARTSASAATAAKNVRTKAKAKAKTPGGRGEQD